MTTLGIFHTAISIAAIAVAAVSLLKDKFILPNSSLGKTYSVLNAVACTSSFWLSKAGGFNPGHAIGILVLVMIAVTYLLHNKNFSQGKYIMLFCMSFSLFLSFVPAVNETLTRIPIGHPLAANADAAIIKQVVLLLLLMFIGGLIFQFSKLKKEGNKF
ncbi:MAG: hypothetical protein RIQ33_440 [Bacteroidota bacterium]